MESLSLTEEDVNPTSSTKLKLMKWTNVHSIVVGSLSFLSSRFLLKRIEGHSVLVLRVLRFLANLPMLFKFIFYFILMTRVLME